MSMSRCSCIYRASSAAELRTGTASIKVRLVDPWCPALSVHARTSHAPEIVVADDAP